MNAAYARATLDPPIKPCRRLTTASHDDHSSGVTPRLADVVNIDEARGRGMQTEPRSTTTGVYCTEQIGYLDEHLEWMHICGRFAGGPGSTSRTG